MSKPNLFIVGAGKAGTTALYEYLRQVPDIFMSEIKEPHYFCSDFHVHHPYSSFARFTDEATYLSLYQNAGNHTWIGEASPTYLISQVAAKAIYDFNPDARIIIMLRNPVEMLYAAYYQLYFTQIETLPSFEAALAAQDARSRGQQLPDNLRIHPVLFQYYEVANYPVQLQRFWDIFPREQIHIIIYDDFKANTERAVRDTLRFLDIDPDIKLDFTEHNRSKTFHNSFLQHILYQPPVWLVRAAKLVQPVTRPVYRRLKIWNIREEKRPSMRIETRQMLQSHFRLQIDTLSQMLDRDLSHWYRD